MALHPLLDRIAVDTRICFGKPVIRGTRIWVSLILDSLANGLSFGEVLAAYPELAADDLRAALAYGALAARQSPAGRDPMDAAAIRIRSRAAGDDAWVPRLIRDSWGSEMVFVHGTSYWPARLPGFVATLDETPVGLLTYTLGSEGCEIVTLDSLREGQGIATRLIGEVRDAARQAGETRLWLVTTNDNTRALRLYQRCGFHLEALRPGAVDETRKFKPQIPMTGEDDIPIRDEIVLAQTL